MPPDQDLLRQFAESRDERAFAELVRRHADLVYSVARRVARNDAIAQDVGQRVFTKLASHAGDLSRYDTIVGWLHTAARHAAIDAVRVEERRRTHEQESAAMQSNSTTPRTNWDQIGPLLDEAVASLREDDRKAVLLRFFQGLSHQEVGAALGLSEDTGRKRIERALEKLRTYFAQRGVTASSILLAAAISENSVQAAPSGFTESVAQSSLTGSEVVPGPSLGPDAASESVLQKIFPMNPKIAILLAVIIILMLATWAFYPHSPQIMATTAAAKKEGVALGPLVASPKAVALAIAPPAPNPAATLGTDNQPDADPQADLKSVLQELARLELASDDFTALKKFTPPDSPNMEFVQALIQQHEAMEQKMEANNPGFLKMAAAQAETHPGGFRVMAANNWEELEDQTPTYNAAGDEATYVYTSQPFQLRSGRTVGEVAQRSVTFIKINGKWYEKALGEVRSGLAPAPPPPPSPPPGLPASRGMQPN